MSKLKFKFGDMVASGNEPLDENSMFGMVIATVPGRDDLRITFVIKDESGIASDWTGQIKNVGWLKADD